MAKGPVYVKDFDFSSAGKTIGRCDDGMTKMASGGYYSKGGSAKAGQAVQMAKSNAVAKSLVGQKATPYAKGGMKEAATGERYPSRSAMMKHESMETPRMQREEVIQSRTVKAPMRRQMPVASAAPMIQAGGMKKGGFVKGGTGMVKTEGTLGIKGNKNPGERNGKPTQQTKKGNVPFKSGGAVKKYADGGPAAPTQTGALNQMAQQQRDPMAAAMAQMQARGPSQGQQIPANVMAGYNAAMQQPQGQLYRATLADGRSVVGERQTIDPKFADVMRSMGLPPGGGLPAGATMTPVNQPQPNMQQPGMGGGMPPEMQQLMAAFNRDRAPQGLGQAAMGGSMPAQQLQNLAQQGLGQGTPLGAAPAGAVRPQGYGFGAPQNAPPQASPQMQQQALAAYMAANNRPMPAQPGMQQAPMGMGMGQFGQQTPQQPQAMPARPNLQTAMSRLRGRP